MWTNFKGKRDEVVESRLILAKNGLMWVKDHECELILIKKYVGVGECAWVLAYFKGK